MSVKNGLIAFGISAAVVAGGVASGHEAFDKADQLVIERACDEPKPDVPPQDCKSVNTNPDHMSITETERNVYTGVGIAGVALGALGLIGAYREVSSYDPL
ncbi:MAG TPA: hypothetical protein VFK11_00985 [Candidatus Saccharimonadales bacterium]|nr:hypothetical protein [Candidatus Saccharimonadales bacterium]